MLAALLLISILANGMLAGLFFAFTCAIAPGLGRVDDETYIRAFRAINAAILNRWFLSVFLAAPVAAVGSAVFRLGSSGAPGLPLLIAGAVCSVLTLVITATVNVPLNRELDRATIVAESQRSVVRRRFESRWNHGNFARTVTSFGSLACLAGAALATQ